ncbi:MAG: DUF1778 domain-containing protein [Synergistaceae bacterium]|jgi:uncharacterized protein (DUF1778 family)|nr:DUF1778 domain-containing protein [Synergistaceae bacterium]
MPKAAKTALNVKQQTGTAGTRVFFQGRVPLEVKRRWQTAASLRGQSLTDFLIVAANNAADNVFETEEHISLSLRGQQELVEMLSRPPRPNERLHKAVQEELAAMRKY